MDSWFFLGVLDDNSVGIWIPRARFGWHRGRQKCFGDQGSVSELLSCSRDFPNRSKRDYNLKSYSVSKLNGIPEISRTDASSGRRYWRKFNLLCQWLIRNPNCPFRKFVTSLGPDQRFAANDSFPVRKCQMGLECFSLPCCSLWDSKFWHCAYRHARRKT